MSEDLRGNMLWDTERGVWFEPVAEAPESFRALAESHLDDAVDGKLVE